ncbi:MAG: flagellar export protein FliJ [Defluviitaleaceae bacterium]|nr:flagellar export protein FliJ [Defluviitaleaceae bacterium]
MAKFKFKLNSILKLNESIEDQKKNEFRKAAVQLEIERNKLKDLFNDKEHCVSAHQKALKERIDPIKSDMLIKYIDLVNKRITTQEIEVKKCEEFLEIKRLELVEATKEKKKLEKLKEKQYEQYIIDEKREEQKVTDEVVGYKVYSKIS